MSRIHIFPVRKSLNTASGKWAKVPAIPRGQNWQTYNAGADEFANCNNYGIVIPGGVVVIDLDTQKGVTRKAVELALGCALPWDDALLQYTVSGGQHYGFALPDGVAVRQNSDLLGVVGFDTRAAGKGWICAGDGYTDETLAGLPDGIGADWLPALPLAAISALRAGIVSEISGFEEEDGLSEALALLPIEGLTLDDLRAYLAALPAGEVGAYDSWLSVGMALHHQTRGSKDGVRLWDQWSKASADYSRDEITAKWAGFGKRCANPVTFAYIIKRAGGRGAVVSSAFDALLTRAGELDNLEQYTEFKSSVLKMPLGELGKDSRAMLASVVAGGVGKSLGLTKTEIKGAFVAKKTSAGSDAPGWLAGWIYVEQLCMFANTELGYMIKREAFNAKYDREAECVVGETIASALALITHKIPTVVNTVYWPSSNPDKIIILNGLDMLNTYTASGCDAERIDAEGQKAIDLLLKHVAFTLTCEREQTILLDWLTHVVRNVGQRVNWALLLQGAQGSGKSFFSVLLSRLLGDNAKNLDPAAISGRFTGWATGAVVNVIEEIRISGANRYEILDRMKPFITNETVQIEEKGRDHRTIPNLTSYFLLTNHQDAVPISHGDRRYCVLFSRIQTEAQLYSELGGEDGTAAYFDELFSAMNGNAGAILTWLCNRTISPEFNAKGRAPATNAKAAMINVAMSPDRQLLEDAISEHECAVINDAIVDITWLTQIVKSDGGELPSGRAISSILLELGYSKIAKGGGRIKINKTLKYHYLWTKSEDDSAVETVKQFHDDPDFIPF